MKFKSSAWLCLVMVLIGSGCAPHLASSPLGPEEKQWAEFIKSYYPAWEPPQTIPPGMQGDKVQFGENGIAEENEQQELADSDIKLLPEAPQETSFAPAVDAAPEQPNFSMYKVQKNDTLWRVSKKFYGTGTRWREIEAANSDVLGGKTQLKVGMQLKVPTK